FRFFAFFALVFGLYWALRDNRHRKSLLLLASYVFYGAWDWRFLGLILFITIVSYLVGNAVRRDGVTDRARRTWLTFGILSSLGVLFTFKYFNFFADSFADLAGVIGLPAGQVTLNLVLPVGISFYTFQAISYMVDVARGSVKADRSKLDVAFYIAFFPQLVAGPIVRAADFIPQMETARLWKDVNVRACLALFLIGFIKKACISDNIAPYVDVIFASPETFNAASIVAGVLLYATQIYCDFSGYSDMAIAIAGLLGYKFQANFDSPYFSPNIQDFWRRWHISLSSWLRDYLYIPLGGNRQGEARRNVNLMTTMVLGGLWHGASFNFIIWGVLHGGALTVERVWNRFVSPRFPAMGTLGTVLGVAVTFYWVCLAWIFFRAADLPAALGMAKTYLTWTSDGTRSLALYMWTLIAVLGIVHYLGHRYDALGRLSRLKPQSFAITYGVLFAVALSFVPLGSRPFIYFQF
ncbi:MAG: MBOAT family O-acyltransferase, partial [Hyphomonadaceae bacterium]